MYYIKVSYCRTGYLDWAGQRFIRKDLTSYEILTLGLMISFYSKSKSLFIYCNKNIDKKLMIFVFITKLFNEKSIFIMSDTSTPSNGGKWELMHYVH